VLKTFLGLSVFLSAVVTFEAQEHPAPMAREANESDVRQLDKKIRQAWDDYKNKRKDAFAAIFTEDAVEVEEGADGPHDKKATLAEMDEFDLKSVSLMDFNYRPIGSDGMLVRYTVDYSGTFHGEAIHNKSIIGEVWEKAAQDWKILYFQETKLK